ncbi:MAG: YdcF family protein, partial [bacterium]
LLFGLLNKKERLGLSWKGWLFGIFISISLFIFFLKNIYPFLAPINRIESKILVVEGWVNDENMKQAVEEFKSYNYEHIYVTGGPIDTGSFLYEYKTYAHLGTDTLKKLGIESKKVTAVPGPGTVKDRTFTSALALKKYFEENKIDLKSFNLFTVGPHAKRSQLLFDLAFEHKVKIGIVAAKPFYFDPQSWWTSSAGVRTLLNELIAYPYALFFKYTQIGSLTGGI